MTEGPILPAEICVPIGVGLMLVVAAQRAGWGHRVRPRSRRLLRQASGVLSLLALPLLTAGFSLIDPGARPITWTTVWAVAMLLLGAIVLLALLDLLNTARLNREAERRLRRALQELEAHRSAGERRMKIEEHRE